MSTNSEVKRCTRCDETKPLNEFNRDRSKKDGLNQYCRICTRAAAKASRQRNPEAVKERNARYAREHREELREYLREYYMSNREKHLRKTREWHEANRYSLWEQNYRRRCERMGLSPVIERFTEFDVVNRWGSSCFYCETGAFEQLDHYMPVSKGGQHTVENVRPSCRSCNRRKGSDVPAG